MRTIVLARTWVKDQTVFKHFALANSVLCESMFYSKGFYAKTTDSLQPSAEEGPLVPRILALSEHRSWCLWPRPSVAQHPGLPHPPDKCPVFQIAETYAFLPREAVTRFLMSCTECQKRMHFNSNGLEPKGT